MSPAISCLAANRQRRILGVPLMDKRKMHAEAAKMLDHLGIRMPSTKLKVENLSGGQRQSIAIGRAVSFNPLVLIMDEPTAALAVAEVDAVLQLIKTVSAKGVSVILITHRLQDLFVVCDRIMVLFEGRNVAERLIGETNIEEIVNLIVGRKFQSVSAGAPAARERSMSGRAVPASERARSGELRARLKLVVHDSGGVVSIAVFFAVMVVVFSLITDTFLTQANILNILQADRATDDRRGRDDLRHHDRWHRSLGRLRAGAGQCARGDLAAGGRPLAGLSSR